MKTKAAVAWRAGAPLTIEEVDLQGPREGEVLIELKATGICHTDYYTLSGADPEGLFPAILGPRRRGHRGRCGPGRENPEKGRPRDSAVHAGMPPVQILPVAQDQPVPGDPLDPGPRPDAGRDQPLLARRQAAVPLHGHLDVLELHRGAGNRAGENPRRCAVRQGLLHRLRRHHRRGRGAVFGQGRGGRQRRRVRPRRHRPERDSGQRRWSAPTRSSASISTRRARTWRASSA